MPGYDKIPTYLNPEQRHALTQIPSDLSERDIARYYTFTEKERELINRRRRASNRLGFAVQLALLKFPGRTLMEVKEVPRAVLTAIAEQVEVPASAFTSYGDRENTLYEHLDELRRECGFRSCGWREYLLVARSLLPDAMESDRPLPLIETALERLRTESILAPNMIYVERLVWIVLKIAERKLLNTLTRALTLEQRTRLDGLLHADTSIRGATRLSWLRQAPGVASPKSEPSLQALEYVSTLAKLRRRVTGKEQKVGKVKMNAPLGHLTQRWRKHALEGDTITPNYYEAAAFEALKGRVRSGDVAVSGSRRYRPFENYLLPTADFEQLTEKQQTRLVVNKDAEVYLAAKQQEIFQKLTALQESIGKVEGSLVLDEKGHLHLPSLEKAVPEEVERLQKRVYTLLPHIPLADLLLEVDNWTGFLRHFMHLTSRDAPIGVQKLELVAALMGMGMNLGLEKMAESCPFTYRQLSWSIDWHIREETLLASQANLDNFVLAAPLSSAWGDGTTSSSDGMRMYVGVKAANAERNAKYFHSGWGTNIYVHAADIWVPFGKPQIIGTNEEALYVIDALCHHESDLHIQEHYTDTGGSTEHVFALTALLGFRFAPRLRDALSRHLYLVDEGGTYESLSSLLFGQIKSKLIIEQWDEMRRVASSIRHGTVSASLLMRKLAAYPRQNQVARALTEMGKLEQTAYLLEYFRDEALRRRVLIGLNKGEALHALARQLFFGRLGELRDRAFEDQMHRASCLHLIMAAIAAWNTVYLTKAIETLRKRGEDIPESTVAHIAPLGWEHIRLIGDYHFAPQSGRSLENLRPLRLREEDESA